VPVLRQNVQPVESEEGDAEMKTAKFKFGDRVKRAKAFAESRGDIAGFGVVVNDPRIGGPISVRWKNGDWDCYVCPDDLELADAQPEIASSRPGRPCWYRKWLRPGFSGWLKGYFHTFTQDSSDGEGPMASAIIEEEDGQVVVVCADNVNFGEEQPTK
jgi:hypothetical protein